MDHALQSWPRCFGQTVVFVWNSTLREKFCFYFWGIFCWYWRHFGLGGGTGRWAIILWSFKIFLIFSQLFFFFFLCGPKGPPSGENAVMLFGNCWVNSYIPCLLLIITIHFTCGDKKSSSNIKKSQNIMTRIVVKHWLLDLLTQGNMNYLGLINFNNQYLPIAYLLNKVYLLCNNV